MEEARKIIESQLTLMVSAIVALSTAIVAMAVYFVASKKSEKRDYRENFTIMSNVLLKTSESNTALSNSIDQSREQQDKIAERTERLLTSLTEKIIELKNGKH